MFEDIETSLKFITNYPNDNEKLGVVIHCKPEYNHKTIDEVHKLVEEKNKKEKEYGYHYIISHNKIYNLVPAQKAIKSLDESKLNYIGKNIFDSKPNLKLTSILVILEPNVDYEKTEQTLIYEIQRLLKAHKIYSDSVWRAFDLCNEDYSPLHILDLNIFKSHINLLNKFVPIPPTGSHVFDEDDEENPKPDKPIEPTEPPDPEDVDFISPFKSIAESSNKTIDALVRDIYKDNEGKEEEYAKKFKAWDKDIEMAKEAVTGELKTVETPEKNDLQYQITTQPPGGSCGCSSDFDTLKADLTSKDLMVEPIYPDLITPPGANITIGNDSTGTKIPSESNSPLTPEEFEKRQQQFSFSDFKKVRKETVGRPINCEDPFPVDEQIKKMEEHNPKVKIDKIKFEYEDSNHDGDLVGQAISKNNNMIYDVITGISKRTETRLVKIENNLSTVMRNLFRVSSRMHINCCYYGGQSVYGKYLNIRCLGDDRLHDGAVVSLDQCLSCTRYEPILGQVYAILEDSATNVAAVMDDMQMSYMTVEDYNALTQFGEYWVSPENADLSKNATDKPIPFVEKKWKDTEIEAKAKGKTKKDIDSKDYKQGFSMDWTPVQLETQSPNINKYKKEETELDKDNISTDLDREIFEDTRDGNVQYEQLEFDIKDYILEDFGKGSNLAGGSSGGNGGAVIRQKIVDYMHAAEAKAKEGKLNYSQGQRMNHDGKAVNGIHYYDCSSLVGAAYKAAGITTLNGGNTVSQYPKFTDKQGGLLFPISDLKNAKPGDILCFASSGTKHPKTTAELQSFGAGQTSHTAIYIGDNKYIDTGRHYPDDPSKDCKTKDRNNYVDKRMFAFARPKALVEADAQSSAGGNIEAWSREFHNIPDELWNASKVAISNVSGLESNMKKYGYRDVLVKMAQAYKYDPIFIAAVCAIESSGNPMSGGGYPGIIQSSNGFQASDLKGIKECLKRGCEFLDGDKAWLKKFGWDESNTHLLASTHNNGKYGTVDALGHDNESMPGTKAPLLGKKADLKTCKIPEVASHLKEYAQKFQRSWNPEEKRTYACKVLRAYNIIYEKNLLNLPKDSGKTFIRPVKDVVSSIYGMRGGRMHKGVDYACHMDTSIKASASGKIIFCGEQSGYGKCIQVEHADKYSTFYAHLNDFKGRKVGDQVKQSEELCLSGNTGVGSGPHLHFEIRKNNIQEDPSKHVPQSSKKGQK